MLIVAEVIDPEPMDEPMLSINRDLLLWRLEPGNSTHITGN